MKPQENPSGESERGWILGVLGCGTGKGQGEGPVTTKVTYGEVRRLNCQLDNGNYKQNNQTYEQQEDKA